MSAPKYKINAGIRSIIRHINKRRWYKKISAFSIFLLLLYFDKIAIYFDKTSKIFDKTLKSFDKTTMIVK